MDTPQEKDLHALDASVPENTPPMQETPATFPVEVVASVLPPTKKLPFYKSPLYIAIFVALILLGGAGYYMYDRYHAINMVAVVNGVRINQADLAESIKMFTEAAESQGIDTADAAVSTNIRTQALDVLINNVLLTTGAKKAGFGVSDAEIQEKHDELAVELGGAEELTKRMGEIGISDEKLRENIAERVLVDKYIESVTDIEILAVTEEEVAAFIASLNIPEGADAPNLDEIRPQIEAQILNQKQQKIINDLLQKLRAEGSVTIKQ